MRSSVMDQDEKLNFYYCFRAKELRLYKLDPYKVD